MAKHNLETDPTGHGLVRLKPHRPLRRRCAWCGLPLDNLGPIDPDEVTTDGMCEPCSVAFVAEASAQCGEIAVPDFQIRRVPMFKSQTVSQHDECAHTNMLRIYDAVGAHIVCLDCGIHIACNLTRWKEIR